MVIAGKACSFLLFYPMILADEGIIMRLIFESYRLFSISARSSLVEVFMEFATAPVMIPWHPLLCQILHVHYQWLRLQLPGVTSEAIWVVLGWGLILVIPRSPILRFPRIGGPSITKLLNVSILGPFGFLIAHKLITLIARINIDLVILFIARQLIPALHSGHEEAFAEARFLFLYRLKH